MKHYTIIPLVVAFFMTIFAFGQEDICDGVTKIECINLTVKDFMVKNLDLDDLRCTMGVVEKKVEKLFQGTTKKCLKAGVYRNLILLEVDTKGRFSNIEVKSGFNHVKNKVQEVLKDLPFVFPLFEDGKPVVPEFMVPLILEY